MFSRGRQAARKHGPRDRCIAHEAATVGRGLAGCGPSAEGYFIRSKTPSKFLNSLPSEPVA